MRISDWSADVCSSDLFILQVDDLLLRFEQHGRKNEYVPVQRGSVPRQRLDRLGDAVHPRCFFDRLSNEFFHVAHPNNSSASSGVRPRSSIGSSSSTFGRNAMSLSTESAVSPRRTPCSARFAIQPLIADRKRTRLNS